MSREQLLSLLASPSQRTTASERRSPVRMAVDAAAYSRGYYDRKYLGVVRESSAAYVRGSLAGR